MGIGLMDWDRKMYNILKEQDTLYTLLSRGHTGSEARVVGSIVDFMFAPDNHQAVIDKVSLRYWFGISRVTAAGRFCVCSILVVRSLFSVVAAPLVMHPSLFMVCCYMVAFDVVKSKTLFSPGRKSDTVKQSPTASSLAVFYQGDHMIGRKTLDDKMMSRTVFHCK